MPSRCFSLVSKREKARSSFASWLPITVSAILAAACFLSWLGGLLRACLRLRM